MIHGLIYSVRVIFNFLKYSIETRTPEGSVLGDSKRPFEGEKYALVGSLEFNRGRVSRCESLKDSYSVGPAQRWEKVYAKRIRQWRGLGLKKMYRRII